MLVTALVLATLAAPAERPTIAVLPPAPIEGADAWLGYAVADELASGLLGYARQGGDKHPFNVFSWREATSAARGDGLDVSRPLSAQSVAQLGGQLGARYVFTGSYRQKGVKVLLKWRLTDLQRKGQQKELKVTTNVATLSARSDKMLAAVLKALGEKGVRLPKVKPLPMRALAPYARGLQILAKQSLDPYAQVVLPAVELKRAQKLFTDATVEAPTMWRAWSALGVTCAMLGQLGEAEQAALQAAAYEESSEPATALGVYYVLARQQKLEEAVGVLAQSVTSKPGFLGGLGYLGNAHLRMKRPKKSAEVFAVYSQRVPKSPWARVMHARALAYAGDHPAAIAETQAVAKQLPGSVMVTRNLAARLAQAGQYDEALETLERGLALHTDHPTLLNQIAYVKLEQGKPAEALSVARRAVEQLGDGRGETIAGYAYVNLGRALAQLGNKEEARQALERAAALGVDAEEKLQLAADETTQRVVQEATSALTSGAPTTPAAVASATAVTPPAAAAPAPPTPSATPAAPTAPREAASAEPADVGEDDEAWSEGEGWDESEDWSEADYDDVEEAAAGAPSAK